MYRSLTPCVIFLPLFLIDHILAAGVNNSSWTSGDDGASTNKSSSTEHCAVTVGLREVNITVHVLTLIASFAGNILLIIAFVRMKEPIMLLIANMAASDLLAAIFFIPRLITSTIIGSNAFLVDGNAGMFLCKMCTFLSDISFSVSTQSLVLIAVERFLAVVNPILYKLVTVKIRRILVVSTWIMAMAIHSPYFYTFRLETVDQKNDKHDSYKVCQSNWEPAFDNRTAHIRYNMFLFATVLIVPLLVICVLYTVIVLKLRRDKMGTYRSDKGTRRVKERNRNLENMAIATVVAFLICWAPYIVIAFIRLFSPEKVPKCSKSFEMVDYISRLLTSSYCAVNPWICFIFMRNFTRELSRICLKGQRRSSSATDRKLMQESGISNTYRTEVQRSLSESLQITTLLSRSNEKNLRVLESLCSK